MSRIYVLSNYQEEFDRFVERKINKGVNPLNYKRLTDWMMVCGLREPEILILDNYIDSGNLIKKLQSRRSKIQYESELDKVVDEFIDSSKAYTFIDRMVDGMASGIEDAFKFLKRNK